MSDEDNLYKMEATLGRLTVEVSGNDEEWVAEKFEETWESRLEEAQEMKEAIRRGDVSAQ